MKQILRFILKQKQLFFILMVLLLNLSNIQAQVTYTGDVNLTSQAEVDAFRTTTAYTYIDGNLSIRNSNSDITNLNGIQGLDSISGYLLIMDQKNLDSLSGLNTLKAAEGDVTLSKLKIENLDGLQNLIKVGGRFSISNCQTLQSLDGLNEDLQLGYLMIGHTTSSYGNSKLKDFCSISDLIIEKLNSGDCTIANNYYNPTLQDMQDGECARVILDYAYYGDVTFENQTMIDTFYSEEHPYSYVVGDVQINSSVENLLGLAELDSIDGGLKIYDAQLESLEGLDSLKKIGGQIYMTGLTIDTLNHLDQLQSVGSNFQILNFEQLTHISLGTTNFHSITINYCNKIDTLDLQNIDISYTLKVKGCNNLKSIVNFNDTHLVILMLQDNPMLNDLSGFSLVETIQTRLLFTNNDAITSFDDFSSLNTCNIFDIGVYNGSEAGNDNLIDYCEIADVIIAANTVRIDYNLYNPTVARLQEGKCLVPDSLTGTVTISGILKYGEELAFVVDETNNTGTLSYQWKRDDVAISGANSTTYTLVAEDIASSISVEINSSEEIGSISSTGTAVIEKADEEAPVAPTLESKTHNNITLNVVEGCEYAIDGGEWQSSVEFTGLTAETTYSLTQRYAETATHKASAASDALDLTTDEEPIYDLTGTVTVTGTLQFDEELTVAVTETNNTGTLSYQWKRNDEAISGAESTTYTLVEEDITKSISVEVTSSVETGSISSIGTAAIEKADQEAPAAPTLASKTHNNITLNVVEGCEYVAVDVMSAVDMDNLPWQVSEVFDALTPETEYNCYQRYAETTTHKASSVSDVLNLTTDEESYSVNFNISGETKSLTNLLVVFDGTEYTVNDNGTLVIENILPGTYNYSITAQGYDEHASTVTIEDQDINLDVVLKLATAIGDVDAVNIKVYPNPAVSYVEISGLIEGEDLILFDIIGNKVIHKKVESRKEQIDLSSVKSGIYFVKTGDRTLKIIVEK